MQSYNEARKNIKKKKTNIKGDPKKFKGVGSTYEAAQKVSQPKKKVVNKQVGADDVKKAIVRSTRTTTKKPFGLGPDDKAYGALPKKKRTGKPVGFSAEAVRQGKKQRNRFTDKVDLTNVSKKRTAQPFGPGAKDVEQAGRTRRGEPKVTVEKLSSPPVTDPVKLKKLSSAIAQTKQAEEAARLKREKDKDDLFVEKTGGKLSRKKGGTVSRNTGGKVFNGNDEVSKYYDM